MAPLDPLLTVADVCAALQLSRATVYRLKAQGALPYRVVKIGHSIRFVRSDVARHVSGETSNQEKAARHFFGRVERAKARVA